MTQQNETNSHLSSAVDQLGGIGKWWADYGRTVGKAALEHSAEALKTSADFLSLLSAKLEPAIDVEIEKDEEPTDAQSE